ncbi:Cof-type HAD-IIB family hydrolase [Ureaplasma zalophigenitalium]|uniref:Cof-type HAD-IIB family hydrolase n=1 Tax=Ureaplasma zalophigenitalium TaxID=907723 RepID=A0ABT3BNH4_9BACT|nr:Cof-type HAD-IIB family hydrolase [Ureaplasma zalophigenitalium]MCV3753805.1 Cof-type HAD-IIB family hydrolase [Ureaplasma zalophigenitalium]
MKHPYLFSDLDQTLLQKNKKISKFNYQMIKKFYEAGGTLIFVTGRSLERTVVIADQILEKTGYIVPYFICFGGALIYDNLRKKVLLSSQIDPLLAQEAFDYVLEKRFGLWPYNNLFTNQQTIQFKNIPYWRWIRLWHKEYQFDINPLNFDNTGVFKINVLSPSIFKKIPTNFYEQIIKYFKDRLQIIFTNPWIIEITNRNINKGYAIEWLANYMEINLKTSASIGDSMNDLAMFLKTNLRAAAKVRNKKILDYVDLVMHKKNNKNSVGKFIQHLLKE